MLRADRVVVRQDAQGLNYAYAYGRPAYFRQKREGFDEYVEGNAERMEYDGKKDKVEMFTNAQVKKGVDEVRGDYISYDAVTEFYQVVGGATTAGATTQTQGRVRATIQPKRQTQPSAAQPSASRAPGEPPKSGGDAAPGAPLKPATRLKNEPER
jgi:lipopolysaccharide export system protein LptA